MASIEQFGVACLTHLGDAGGFRNRVDVCRLIFHYRVYVGLACRKSNRYQASPLTQLHARQSQRVADYDENTAII
jgi:hypothetical protein